VLAAFPEAFIPPVRRRLTFLLTGYEPLPPAAHHRRFAREIRRFEATWSLSAQVGHLREVGGRPIATWPVRLSGPDFTVDTEVRLLRWDDIVAEDMEMPLWQRLPRYLASAADIILTGTFFRYIVAYWRYGLFAAYPLVLLALFAVAGWLVSLVPGALGLPLPGLLRLVMAAAVFVGLAALAGPRLHLTYMLADWIFARDMMRQRRPSLAARAEAFAREIAAALTEPEVDEVVIVAHSLGAAWMLDAVSRALAAEPSLPRAGGPSLGLLGAGSSTLKIALHPAAGWLRAAVQRVGDAPHLTWAEYDSHVDFICFYKNNTPVVLGLTVAHPPIRRSIRLSRMLSPATWQRFRGNLLRIHRQYVMGNEQRYLYDMHMIACGPFSFAEIARRGDDLPGALGADGSLAKATTPILGPVDRPDR
jgi:hypothetical protein